MSSGQVVAALAPLAAGPVVGRLYPPTDYAALALYMALAGLLGTVSVLRYDKAILAERSERAATSLIRLCAWLALATAAVSVPISATIVVAMGESATYGATRWWLLTLPILVLSTGLSGAMSEFLLRHGAFGMLGRLRAVSSLLAVSGSITFGLLGFGAHGLIANYTLASLATTLLIHRQFRRIGTGGGAPLREGHARVLLRRHKPFAFYTMPTELIGMAFHNLPVFALSVVGALPLLGTFVRARQLVFLPIQLVGSAILNVFRASAMEDLRAGRSFLPRYDKTLLSLLAIGLPSMMILWLIAPTVVVVYLGPAWVEAGDIARWLTPLLLLRILAMPAGAVFQVGGWQKAGFRLHSCACACGALMIAIAVIADMPAHSIVAIYVIIYAVLCVMSLARARCLSAFNAKSIPEHC
ncbi:oligosaccharide flippase family protein [Acuticoccus sp. M5D2P5]|uniref:oligosaccharide flippase family protein n=1 Tax=Acuticoccus kalidii TaxID=2910977 RepID=UPI001F3796C1|nr:oligosaccharide flippase family protein [Acuticoccus kalidii]MCF3936664.1 oligosaccharide flippase family protein [Acuticoccus kalidii]